MVEGKKMELESFPNKNTEINLLSYACYKAIKQEISIDLKHNGFAADPISADSRMQKFSNGVYNANEIFRACTIDAKTSKKAKSKEAQARTL